MKKTHERLPSLKAIRAFEVAARLESFSKAAEQLFITQSAVSRLVQGLERDIGSKLFRRRGRYLDLTDAGRNYAAALTEAFKTIARATHMVRAHPTENTFTVTMLPSFAVKWFAPRLPRFLAQHPNVDLRISATRTLATFTDDIDAAIRFGDGKWPDTQAELLLKERFFPVCSPTLRVRNRTLRDAQDLNLVNLLHGDAPIDWDRWCSAAGVECGSGMSGPRFDEGAAMIQAAIDGAGVALGRTTLVCNDVNANTLTVPFGPSLESDYACYLVRPNWREPGVFFEPFRKWIRAEMTEAANCDPAPILYSEV